MSGFRTLRRFLREYREEFGQSRADAAFESLFGLAAVLVVLADLVAIAAVLS